ncbi:HNH endonuclease family protein, partial [Candidatus Marithioploca araucensis]|nr:HNH endonuclease family protein [Candidatus Marithioploca araucensis]
YEKSSQIDFVDGVKGELFKKKYPSDSQFFNAIKTFQLYNKKSSETIKKAKFLLGRLDGFQNKEPVNVNNSDITIEHVMPQNLTPEWKKMLGDDWQTIQKTLCNTIGNLTLSGDNQKLARLEFFKKKILQESSLRLNRYFANLSRSYRIIGVI